MFELRPYQRESINLLWEYISKHDGQPCVVLPTGAGKSVVIAELCREAVLSWPETRILMLTSRKELIEQNATKMLTLWPNAPLGIFSASIGRRDIDRITFAGIQSVRKRAMELGRRDLVIIDEAHEIAAEETGAYRTLIGELAAINPAIRVIGFTATPYRLGHGMITDKPAIFDELIEPVTIKQLMDDGYLSRLVSKHTGFTIDAGEVHKRGGEYIESELQALVDTDINTMQAVEETTIRAGSRKAWLFFCAGVEHAEHVKEALEHRGVSCACVTGKTPKAEREEIIRRFRAGELRALTNANILTTGFDYPDIDLIVMLRPTLSPGLYMQMAGRGLRLKSHGGDCMVLDFAGNVAKHGPIIAVNPPNRRGKGDGVAPSKICPECDEIVLMSARVCPACGFKFTKEEDAKWRLANDDIMGEDRQNTVKLKDWQWTVEISNRSKKQMIVCRYYPEGIGSDPIKEYFCVWHDGFAGVKGRAELAKICEAAGIEGNPQTTQQMEAGRMPESITYIMDGKFPRILARTWAPVLEPVYLDEVPF
jgi:DNA repair protein RadD